MNILRRVVIKIPELPEVETVRRDLQEIVGKIIVFNRLLDDRVFKTPFYNMQGLNSKIESIERYGKYLVIKFDNSYALLVHLGMSGKLILEDGSVEIQKHCSWLIQLNDGQQIRYIDHRYFGKAWHVKYDYAIHYVQSRLGPEPFDLKTEDFILRIKQNKYLNKTIKEVLLDQGLIAGIGNIYASEICYEAFIHPKTLVKDLTDKQFENILFCTRRVLNKAIKNNGTTFKDYRNAKNRKGNNQSFLKAYKQIECNRCLYDALKILGPDADISFPIKKEKIKDRVTYYCESCQKL